MIPALLFAVAMPCDAGPLLRAVEKSALPPRTARVVAAKVRYAETMCKLGRLAPFPAREELGAARTMAAKSASVTTAIDSTIRTFDEAKDVPARLAIHTQAPFVVVDGVKFRPMAVLPTLQLRAGTHEINGVSVTLAEGEPRSIELPAPREVSLQELRQGHFIWPSIEPIVPPERLGEFCIRIHRNDNGERVTMKSIEHVTVEKRGTFDATELFALSERGDVCVADAEALREMLRTNGPWSVRIAGRAAGGERVDTGGGLTLGHTIVVRGTVPEGVRFVQHNGHEPVAVKDGGRFELVLPEERTEIVATTEPRKMAFMHSVEFHCDAEVRATKEKLEVLSGGCANAGGAGWNTPEIPPWEEVQSVSLDFKDGSLAAGKRFARHLSDLAESVAEDAMPPVREGVLQVRAYAENGVLVHRSWQQLQLVGTGCIPPTTVVFIDAPPTAAVIEVKGWTAQTSGRFKLAEFAE